MTEREPHKEARETRASEAASAGAGGSAGPRRRSRGRPGLAIRHRAEYAALRTALFALRLIGETGARKLGEILGTLTFSLFRIRRRVTLDNLRHAFPDLSEQERSRIAAKSYRHFGVVFLELARLASFSQEQFRTKVRFSDESGIAEALTRGRGVVMVTGHFGNWEMLGGAMAARGLPISVTAATQRNPWVDRWVTRAREASGMRVLKVEEGALAMARELRKNHLLAFVADQDAGRRGVFVEFFGRAASTAMGPVRLARVQRCPIIGGYAVRKTDGTYDFQLSPARFVRDDLSGDEAEHAALEDLSADLEAMVRRYPEQWFWMHRRWKTRPHTGGEV